MGPHRRGDGLDSRGVRLGVRGSWVRAAPTSPATPTSSDPAEIERCDPAFNKPLNSEGHVRWLAGPIQRYCQDVQDIAFSLRLDSNRPLQGSYGLQIMARVTLTGMRTKEFCMWQVRRYEPNQVITCLRKLGWATSVYCPSPAQNPPQGRVHIPETGTQAEALMRMLAVYGLTATL